MVTAAVASRSEPYRGVPAGNDGAAGLSRYRTTRLVGPLSTGRTPPGLPSPAGRLRDEVVSDGPDPSTQVPVQTGRMCIEQARKDGGRDYPNGRERRHRFCAAWFHHRSNAHVLPGAAFHVHSYGQADDREKS